LLLVNLFLNETRIRSPKGVQAFLTE